jgi:hypothetical protein
VNGNVELREHALDALRLRWFDQSDRRTLGYGQNHRTWNGENRGQREDGRVVIIEGSLVLAIMIQEAVRRHVAVHHHLGVSMLLRFVNVLGGGERQ